MRFNSAQFFCSEESPQVHIEIDRKDKNDPWPVTLRINSSNLWYQEPSIKIFMTNEHLDAFLESIERETSRLAEEDAKIVKEGEPHD